MSSACAVRYRASSQGLAPASSRPRWTTPGGRTAATYASVCGTVATRRGGEAGTPSASARGSGSTGTDGWGKVTREPSLLRSSTRQQATVLTTLSAGTVPGSERLGADTPDADGSNPADSIG